MAKLDWQKFFTPRAAGKSTEQMYSVVAGAGANTNIAISGIKLKDGLIAVIEVPAATTTLVDRTATTAITSDGNIQCTVSTSGNQLLVIWAQRKGG